MGDRKTLDVYAARARDYADLFGKPEPDRHLAAFIAAMPNAGRVLDLGCGPGQSSALMKSAGLKVDALDASPEMAALAKERFGLSVQVTTFDTLDAVEAYDGVYANFSLLHAPKVEMADHLARISTALRTGGLFHIGLKTGESEARDDLGRFYAYYHDAEITGLLMGAGLDVVSRSFGADTGLAGDLSPWIILLARKSQ